MAERTAYAGPRLIGFLCTVLAAVGIIAAVAGPVYAINGATQAPATVRVPVQLEDAGPTPADGLLPLPVGGLPDTAQVSVLNGGDQLQLAAWDSTIPEQMLSRGDAAVTGLAVGVAAWLLRPLLASVAAGRPFGRGNARRLGGLSVVVLVAGYVGPLLPQVGALLVLDRLGLTDPGSPFVLGLEFSFGPLLVGLLLLVLAEAFRQGERLDRDVAGLV
ncbi:DUF2975 domain-containing protein [Modestobacter sp. SYSU DS0290]